MAQPQLTLVPELKALRWNQSSDLPLEDPGPDNPDAGAQRFPYNHNLRLEARWLKDDEGLRINVWWRTFENNPALANRSYVPPEDWLPIVDHFLPCEVSGPEDLIGRIRLPEHLTEDLEVRVGFNSRLRFPIYFGSWQSPKPYWKPVTLDEPVVARAIEIEWTEVGTNHWHTAWRQEDQISEGFQEPHTIPGQDSARITWDNA